MLLLFFSSFCKSAAETTKRNKWQLLTFENIFNSLIKKGGVLLINKTLFLR